jgi:Zn-dependent protease with chaperone function
MTADPKVTFFDGETATAHEVALEVRAAGLRFSGPDTVLHNWAFENLKAIDRPYPGGALRLTCSEDVKTRLIVPPGRQNDLIIARVPHLCERINMKKAGRTAMWVGGSVVVVGLVVYGTLSLAPTAIANMLPNDWRQRVGTFSERSLVKKARRCNNPSGQRALLKLASKVASGANSAPDFSVRVYDMKMMNAFAVPGGRMVITRGLLKAAETPGEVAGVFAHELGHVKNRHPEAAMVRLMGIQVLTSLISGGADTDTIASIAGIATFLAYSRSAEAEADAYAQKILTRSNIDTSGLIAFFERVKKLEAKLYKGKAGKALSMLSTHPGTDERIKKLKPLPKGQAIDVLTPIEWKALKNICNRTQDGEET